MSSEPTNPAPRAPACWPVALALFATVFSARAWMVLTWGSAVPSWDEWDAFALKLYRPWLDGSLTWADLFAAHNEHRIVLTRLADLGLFTLNGGWNPWWQLLLNAALHALTAASLLRIFWPRLTTGTRNALVVLLVLLFTSTSGWQNALWGFQSNFYFYQLLTVLALAGLLLAPAFSRSWWLGWFAALFALLASGGGVLASFATLGAGLGAWLDHRGDWRARLAWPAPAPWLAIFAIGVLGWWCRVPSVGESPMRAQNALQFLATFSHGLSWPWVDSSWLFLLLNFPVGWLLIHSVRERRLREPGNLVCLGLFVFVCLHAAAVAYSRGGVLYAARPVSRYQDILMLGILLNFVVLLRFFTSTPRRRLLLLAWSGLFAAGLLILTETNLAINLPLKRVQGSAGLNQIRAYLAGHEAEALHPESELLLLHPSPPTVQRVLDDPLLGKYFPREFSDPAVRPPGIIVHSGWLTLLAVLALTAASFHAARPPRTALPAP